MDGDEASKQGRIERCFSGAFSPWQACGACGTKFLTLDEERPERSCGSCLDRQILARVGEVFPVRISKKQTHCKYCSKKRKLYGVWCQECRDSSHRREIQTLLEQKNLNPGEKANLRFFKNTAVWKKEFKGRDA